MRFHEFKADGSTLAVRRINRYADEIGKDSMDYDMFKKSAELLDKQMLKSLAKHIEDSDTAQEDSCLCLPPRHLVQAHTSSVTFDA